MKQTLFNRLLMIATMFLALCGVKAQTNIPSEKIFCRDPFITVDHKAKCYYLIVSRSNDKGDKLFAYKSTDLKYWDEVGFVFNMPAGYPGTHDWWAPDTYFYKGNYYSFVTLSNPDKNILRGTTVLRSKNGPAGPYETFIPDSRLFVTPQGMQCLDGSLYIDEKKNPWVVFSVEWNGPNVKNMVGEVWCQRLNKKLDGTVGEPHRLFAADEAPWPMRVGEGAIITDAPFLWKDKKSGNLLMLWSSFAPKYAIGQAISRSGSILGPWEHEQQTIFKSNGGHQMIFEDLEGNLKISFHSPNEGGSHLVIKDIKIENGKFLPIE